MPNFNCQQHEIPASIYFQKHAEEKLWSLIKEELTQPVFDKLYARATVFAFEKYINWARGLPSEHKRVAMTFYSQKIHDMKKKIRNSSRVKKGLALTPWSFCHPREWLPDELASDPRLCFSEKKKKARIIALSR
jgi:hypothetical protein